MISILKAVGAPGSLNFFAVYCLIGLVFIFVWPRNPRLGRRWFVAGAATYVILALPIVANSIASGLPAVPPAATQLPPTVSVIFVLDGDNTVGRLLEARQLHQAFPASTIWVLGRPWIPDAFVSAGVARHRIRYDGTAPDTRSQMTAIQQAVLDGVKPNAIVIVGSRLQMPRIVGLARKAGLRSTFRPSRLDIEPSTRGVMVVVPSYAALRASRDALYEQAALAYYQWLGWIDPVERSTLPQ